MQAWLNACGETNEFERDWYCRFGFLCSYLQFMLSPPNFPALLPAGSVFPLFALLQVKTLPLPPPDELDVTTCRDIASTFFAHFFPLHRLVPIDLLQRLARAPEITLLSSEPALYWINTLLLTCTR